MSQEPKKKLSLFQKIEKISDLVFLNILVVVSCLPIFTIGAAFTAMYSYTVKMVNDEEPPLWKGYWKAFKDNFKQATSAWIIVLIVMYTIYIEYGISMTERGSENANLLMIVMAFEAIFLSFIVPLLFPLISRYENTTLNMFKNAFIINVTNLGSWFYLFFLWAAPIAVYYVNKKIFYYTWYLWIFILTTLIAYASSFILIKLFEKVEKQSEENIKRMEEEAKAAEEAEDDELEDDDSDSDEDDEASDESDESDS